MQFLGRTEFGLSVMAVERHTHPHTRYTIHAKVKQTKMQSSPLATGLLARKRGTRRRKWLKLVRINLTNKCFSKQNTKTPPFATRF